MSAVSNNTSTPSLRLGGAPEIPRWMHRSIDKVMDRLNLSWSQAAHDFGHLARLGRPLPETIRIQTNVDIPRRRAKEIAELADHVRAELKALGHQYVSVTNHTAHRISGPDQEFLIVDFRVPVPKVSKPAPDAFSDIVLSLKDTSQQLSHLSAELPPRVAALADGLTPEILEFHQASLGADKSSTTTWVSGPKLSRFLFGIGRFEFETLKNELNSRFHKSGHHIKLDYDIKRDFLRRRSLVLTAKVSAYLERRKTS